jgi:hypothetical protein
VRYVCVGFGTGFWAFEPALGVRNGA